jgi:acetyltransferase-like isoleucine patch superfamily enzyme
MNEEKNPFNLGYYSTNELKNMGFGSIGTNVQIAKDCKIIGLHNVYIGNNVRIDGHTTISAYHNTFTVGNYVHIGGYSLFICSDKITLEDYTNISQGVRVYAGSDDYSGEHMTNPTIPSEYTNTITAPVTIKKHVIVGSGSVILPGVTINTGSAIGSLTLVKKDLDEWGIYAGTPAKRLKNRSRNLLKYEEYL